VTLTSSISSKYSSAGANFVGVAQQRAHQTLVEGSSAMMCSRLVSTTRPMADLVHLTNGLADHREGIMADFAVGPQVVRADDVAWINLVPRTNSSISMVRVDSRVTFSEFFLETST